MRRPMPFQWLLFKRAPRELPLRVVAFAAFAAFAACAAESPPRGLEETCNKACSVQAAQCSSRQCGRGCNFVIDRLAENEGGRVIACVAAAKRACDDRVWASCATRIGPHADGGPPPPPPPPGAADRGAE